MDLFWWPLSDSRTQQEHHVMRCLTPNFQNQTKLDYDNKNEEQQCYNHNNQTAWTTTTQTTRLGQETKIDSYTSVNVVLTTQEHIPLLDL